jgi:hypothetical protein
MAECKDIYGNTVNNFILKDDGIVYGTYSLTSNPSLTGTPVNSECCVANDYIWSTDFYRCFWRAACETDSLKVILNSNDNDGSIFQVDTNETCTLEVQFDLLLEIDTANILELESYIEAFNGLKVYGTVEKVYQKEEIENVTYESPYGLETVYKSEILSISDLGDYVSGNTKTGIRFTGDYINQIKNGLLTQLGNKCTGVSADTFNSCWLTHKFTITDVDILESIKNEKIKLGVEIEGVDVKFSLLLDKIIMNKLCQEVDRVDKRILKCPGFELERVIDNRKSWCYSATSEIREYDLTQRETNYKSTHSDLLINTKETDLEIDPALAIENNVLSYLQNNADCILSGDPVNFGDLLTTPLSSITTTDEFSKIIKGEFIDAKNRQTITNYPTLRLFYDKYMNPSLYGCPDSAKFKYDELIKYSKSIGGYWSDIIEQLIPATTIWGSSYVYRNSVFDNNKFPYKKWTSFFCNAPNDFPMVGTGNSISVMTSTVGGDNVTIENCVVVDDNRGYCSEPYTACSCPSGYEVNPEEDGCVYTLVTAATYLGSGTTIQAGDISTAYATLGTRFYEDITNKPFPISRVGYTSSPIYDDNGVEVTYDATVNSSFWGLGTVVTGRLNNIGVKGTPKNEWHGFSQCYELETSGTYYIGLAGDNLCRFYINGELIVDFSNNSQRNWQFWHVFPFTLSSGKNIIEMEGKNDDASSEHSFGFELYSATTVAQLTAATNTTEANSFWDTSEKIGDTFDLGETVGYTCPDGYSLDLCSGTPTCTYISHSDFECTVYGGGKVYTPNISSSPEFIGIVRILGPEGDNNSSGDYIIINEN